MKKKILITSAIPYVNGLPHLGHLAGNYMPADAFARYNRLVGNEVLFIGGTDEHGAANEIGAEKEGMPVADYVLKYHLMHKEIYEKFNISHDYFGRSSSTNNIALAQQIAREIHAAGFIEEREVEQIYCVDEKRFLADRYIHGECPHCGGDARGDQCEVCTKLLDPCDLKNPRSAISGSTNLEFRKTKHLYLKLGSLEGRLREWIEKRDWNKLVRGIANKWLKEGLESRAITRDLSWGVPVPLDVWPDMAGKVFYVWFDAPIAYISMTKDFIGEDYLKWWSADSGDTYYEFMGKDNVPFHTIFFPAMLMATEKPWKLVDYVCGQSFLNYKGGKFSKSAKRGIFADAAIAEFPEIDYLRWTLIKNIPETDDSDFSFEIMAGDVNSDLNNVLGNLCLRVAKFYAGKIGTVVAHDFTGELGIEEQVANFHRLMEAREFKKAVAELRRIWAIGNEFIDRAAPWSVFKTDPAAAGEMLVRAMNIVVVGAALAQPFIPRLAQRVLDIFGLRVDGLNAIPRIGAGVKLAVPEVLFEKITPERVAELDEKYK